MPPNPMMPRQPMNMLPPPMPVPPIAPPQAAGTFPVNKDRRKRFGDSLETMLSRPPMVASDQMANMNVFTGQMMNTARPPVAQMRNGGIVRNMRRGGTSMADYSSPEFKAVTYYNTDIGGVSPEKAKPSLTHSQLMDKIRGGSSPNDDKPAPVVTFPDDDDYTPTSAELSQQLANQGLTDMRSDTSAVEMPSFPDQYDRINRGMDDTDAFISYITKYGTQGTPEDRATILREGQGGLSSVPSIPSGTSSTLAQNMITFPQSPDTSMQADPAYLPPDPSYVGSGMNPLTAYGPTSPDAFIGTGPDISAPKNYVGSGANPLTAYGPTSSDAFLGTGDPLDLGIGEELRPKIRPESIGQAGTDSGEDKGFVEKFKDDVKNFGRSFLKDLQMAADAGFFGGYGAMEKRLLEARNPDGSLKYTPDEVTDYIRRTKETQANQLKNQQNQSTDDDSPMSTSPVDPCPAGMRLDPVAGICVPVEEGEDEGPSLDLNRTRDDEFNELDDIMNKIVKPVGDTDEVRTMRAGGSVGLNRAADNFLAAMGG